jgi:gas vesicle protein
MKASNILALLGGVAIGVIVAILLAPDSGKNTREKINKKLKEKGINLSKEELDEFIEKMKKHFGIRRDEDIVLEESDEN